MRLTCVHDFGDVVYLKIRLERLAGMVTGIDAKPGVVSYVITWANDGHESNHYAFELITEFLPDYNTT